jgi:protein involved in polysaccharide export with SLBB domain
MNTLTKLGGIGAVLFLVTTLQGQSQAEIEVRRAQPPAEAAAQRPLVEILKRPEPTAPANAAAPASNNEAGGSSNYRLRTNDVIALSVFGHNDLSGYVTVREDGTVTLPLIKETVKVGGSTLGEVETRIRLLLGKDYIRDPRVQVNVYDYAKIKVYVDGRVNKPGAITVPSNRPITLAQAVIQAGGKTQLGSLKKVTLKRDGKVTTHDVDAMRRGEGAADIILRDGDSIVVPDAGLFGN